LRKIVHIDMDAFYASVEQRDDPSLRGRPVVVAWRGARSVVCAASYEARRFGIRSAMPALRAEKLCPQAVFVPPDFARYKAVSRDIREIFSRHTDLIEPLSLDEAYLDVTAPKSGLASATAIAECIRAEIRAETGLTASAGIAGSKYLAKIASDWRKPDGQFVIRPEQALEFLAPLPVGRLPGVGRVMEAQLAALDIRTVGELRARPVEELQRRFGRYGTRLAGLARAIDDSPVLSERPVQSLSAEDTFAEDLRLDQLDDSIRHLAERAWKGQVRLDRVGRSVVLKLKTSDFRLLTRSHTPPAPPQSLSEFTELALALRERVELAPATRYRLVGVGLGNFRDRDELKAQGALW
jgi:DNA polymerase IV